jgi:hypothetical protein
MVRRRLEVVVVGWLALALTAVAAPAAARMAASSGQSGSVPASSVRAAAPSPAPVQAPDPAPPPASRFGDEIAVRLVTVVTRVVDGAGNPVLGLTPADFRVRVGRHEVPVAAVDWVSGDAGDAAGAAGSAADAAGAAGSAAAAAEAATAAEAAAAALSAGLAVAAEPWVATGPGNTEAAAGTAGPPREPAAAAPSPEVPGAGLAGKLVVIFVQADNNAPSRVRGHLRTLPFTRELLDALQPTDRVAVVSFDSHLKLWQDFTRDREAVPAAIYQAIHFGGRPPQPDGGAASPSLARHFDFDAALHAASTERALAVTAAALSALPGEKVLVFLAWGLGDFSPMGTRMTPAFAPAVRALTAARATVFVLDVTEADSHSLEIGLQGIAAATGGTYDKTNLFPSLAIRQLARTISGHYVLSLDAAALPASGGGVEVELRRRHGTVLLRPATFPAAAGGRSR